jgi:cytochrome c-type biogenesis protein CcmE
MKLANWRTFIAILFILSGVGYLVFTGVSETGVYYRTVTEVLNDTKAFEDKPVRISGEIVNGTINYNQDELVLAFTVRDTEDDSKIMNAVYGGVVPDSFEGDIEVILEGTYDRDRNIFNAEILLAKCPSKYVAEETGE